MFKCSRVRVGEGGLWGRLHFEHANNLSLRAQTLGEAISFALITNQHQGDCFGPLAMTQGCVLRKNCILQDRLGDLFLNFSEIHFSRNYMSAYKQFLIETLLIFRNP